MRQITIALLCCLLPAANAFAAEPAAPGGSPLNLSPELRGFLQAEMREIAGGIQALSVALATADWSRVESTAESIRDTYLMHQKLSPAQRQELARALPEGFRIIDRDFHARADKLAEAAEDRDSELAAFHLYRLTEGCIACHSQFVGYRFTGFNREPENEHSH